MTDAELAPVDARPLSRSSGRSAVRWSCSPLSSDSRRPQQLKAHRRDWWLSDV